MQIAEYIGDREYFLVEGCEVFHKHQVVTYLQNEIQQVNPYRVLEDLYQRLDNVIFLHHSHRHEQKNHEFFGCHLQEYPN